MPNYETLILILRVVFFCLGVGAVMCGWIVLFLAPWLFFVALCSVVCGVLMLVCCVRAPQYAPREKYERDFLQ